MIRNDGKEGFAGYKCHSEIAEVHPDFAKAGRWQIKSLVSIHQANVRRTVASQEEQTMKLLPGKNGRKN